MIIVGGRKEKEKKKEEVIDTNTTHALGHSIDLTPFKLYRSNSRFLRGFCFAVPNIPCQCSKDKKRINHPQLQAASDMLCCLSRKKKKKKKGNPPQSPPPQKKSKKQWWLFQVYFTPPPSRFGDLFSLLFILFYFLNTSTP